MIFNYFLRAVSNILEFGKNGHKLDASGQKILFTDNQNELINIQAKNPEEAQDVATKDYVDNSSKANGILFVNTMNISYNSPLSQIGTIELPIGSLIKEIVINVKTPFDDSESVLQIGTTSNPSFLEDGSHVDLSIQGLNVLDSYSQLDSANELFVTLDSKTSSQGSFDVTVFYYELGEAPVPPEVLSRFIFGNLVATQFGGVSISQRRIWGIDSDFVLDTDLAYEFISPLNRPINKIDLPDGGYLLCGHNLVHGETVGRLMLKFFSDGTLDENFVTSLNSSTVPDFNGNEWDIFRNIFLFGDDHILIPAKFDLTFNPENRQFYVIDMFGTINYSLAINNSDLFLYGSNMFDYQYNNCSNTAPAGQSVFVLDGRNRINVVGDIVYLFRGSVYTRNTVEGTLENAVCSAYDMANDSYVLLNTDLPQYTSGAAINLIPSTFNSQECFIISTIGNGPSATSSDKNLFYVDYDLNLLDINPISAITINHFKEIDGSYYAATNLGIKKFDMNFVEDTNFVGGTGSIDIHDSVCFEEFDDDNIVLVARGISVWQGVSDSNSGFFVFNKLTGDLNQDWIDAGKPQYTGSARSDAFSAFVLKLPDIE